MSIKKIKYSIRNYVDAKLVYLIIGVLIWIVVFAGLGILAKQNIADKFWNGLLSKTCFTMAFAVLQPIISHLRAYYKDRNTNNPG